MGILRESAPKRGSSGLTLLSMCINQTNRGSSPVSVSLNLINSGFTKTSGFSSSMGLNLINSGFTKTHSGFSSSSMGLNLKE